MKKLVRILLSIHFFIINNIIPIHVLGILFGLQDKSLFSVCLHSIGLLLHFWNKRKENKLENDFNYMLVDIMTTNELSPVIRYEMNKEENVRLDFKINIK